MNLANLAIVEPSAHVWDTFVAQHPRCNLLQCSPWGVLKATAGWRTQRIAVLGQGQGNDTTAPAHHLLAGAQLLVRTRYALSVVYIPRGPLLSGDPAVDTLLLTTIEHVARRHRAVFLRLEPNVLETDPEADTLHSWLLLNGFQPADPIQPRSTIHLDLAQPTERLFAGFRKGHRADIRRAGRQNVTVRAGHGGDIDSFYAILQSTGKRADFGIHTSAYYRLAWDAAGDKSVLLLAEQDGAATAAHMVFADGTTGYYLYSGATEAGLKSGANHLLQWHAMQWAKERGCTHYDLWGIPDALGRAAAATDETQRAALEAEAQHDPLIGVYRFKKGFGGAVVRYLPAYDKVYMPPLYALWLRRFR